MQYTIKTISDLIGVAPQTIRYYEEKGLLSPAKNNRTGYRYFDVWDYGMLLNARRYLGYGFGVTECAEILNELSLEEIGNRVSSVEMDLQREIDEKLRMLHAIREWRKLLLSIPDNLNQCSISIRPAMFRLENMDDTEFIDNRQIYARTKQFLNASPFVFNSMRYPIEDVMNDTSHRYSAPGILEADAKRHGITEDDYVKFYPECTCISLIIGGENFDSMLPLSKRIRPAMEFIKEKGLHLAGDIITRMDTIQKHDSGYCSYQTAWLPI